ncbi:hypothetical protein [Clostridium folliculivorans]|uniref:GyrI-like small molecule binding domain-containing protein n=1 Tax=Clostridium folliculivorans TaxID=2886038 RepID=A0A9W6DC33_9CLOT|nr:hypothetical protein [Clostridium folliculivorans]GKU26567.1 hypothetical protein CFOLD11_33940 [Clostridium folliculivorans]GKU29001.1 hypothetical protein CFB3_11070 [Clostridium folliculivorans]
MRSINVYKEIVFSNLIKVSLKGCKDDIIPEVKSFYSCLKEKGIDTYPQIATNKMVKNINNVNVEESEIYVISSEDGLKKVEGLYKTYEEIMWENVVMLEYNGVLLEFQNAVKDLKQYIEKNNMKTSSGFYTYIPHEIKGSDIFSRRIDMNCFVKIE